MKDKVVIESRAHLFSALAEAAEIEHNLMCLYLYAMFGMKRSVDEGVSTEELAAIERWRKVVLGVCLEEMTHLSLVSNLFSALGGSPHFSRPNFPVAPGLYPAGIVIELAPFNLQTLEHFIYLERPASIEMNDGDGFDPVADYHRYAPEGRLMPTSGDYQTVGALYASIREALGRLCKADEEGDFFCGNVNRQITPIDSPLPGLIAVKDLSSALAAIDTIIMQGEGATGETSENSHFVRFSKIKDEYVELLKKNPDFEPGRKVARNPVMRKPLEPEHRVWVDHPVAAEYMDLANAFYVFMLRTLVQVYLIEDRERAEKHELLEVSFATMHLMAVIGETLTLLPSSKNNAQDCFAGMSFAMVRTLTPLSKENELELMAEDLSHFSKTLQSLQKELDGAAAEKPSLNSCAIRLSAADEGVEKLRQRIEKLQHARTPRKKTAGAVNTAERAKDLPKPIEPGTVAPDVETAESDQIRIHFDAKKCIHSRHCVTELPQVFLANTPGKWLFPETCAPDVLAAVIRECPSGALTYESKGSLKDEEAPLVNIMRLYENGPYAFASDLKIDGKSEGYRATLCRCGQSKRKPFCDHSHADAGFIATGEPDTMDATALKARGGCLQVDRTNNGPLSIKGNLEICAGTGRTVLRTTAVNLCRCGHSKTKPVCDGTHATIGFKDPI